MPTDREYPRICFRCGQKHMPSYCCWTGKGEDPVTRTPSDYANMTEEPTEVSRLEDGLRILHVSEEDDI